jgi:uncharacterized membrane protein
MNAKTFFSEAEQQQLVQAIADAELNTSGEIRLHLVDHCKQDPMQEAISTFEKLGMTKTELRNGTLLFVAVKDKKMAIIGDKGINDLVPDDFWDSVKNTIVGHFSKHQYVDGLCQGIHEVGLKLKQHFPYQQNDQNELSNEISFDN